MENKKLIATLVVILIIVLFLGIGKTALLDKSTILSPEQQEIYVKDIIILLEGILMIALIIFTTWLLVKKGKKI